MSLFRGRSVAGASCWLSSFLVVSSLLAAPALAQGGEALPAIEERIEVTATRTPADVLEVPAALTVISGEELEARRVTDLAGALALVGGIAAAPGGDGGPAGAVPEMMGLREFDAFLLVVDGVPWGGAFNPALATLDLTNVERIEVLRGSAPVLFGATSFVGVIQVIHRTPEKTPREVRVGGGSFGSARAAATLELPAGGGVRHALSVDGEDTGFRDDRSGVKRAHVLYRGEAELGGGRLGFDVDGTLLRQDPASPTPRTGRVLSPLVPLDSNQNPRDARLDEDRLHLVGNYAHPLAGGDWLTTLAVTQSLRQATRGFLRGEFEVPPGEANADGFRQTVDQTDVYFDTHLAWHPNADLSIVAGLDELWGRGTMDSDNFEYHVDPDGSGAPRAAGLRVDERPHLEDTRSFAGLYAQGIWTPAPRWRLELGARLNHTRERRADEVRAGDDGDGGEAGGSDSRTVTRGSGTLGASFLAWGRGDQALWLFADVRDAYKPAAVDFGPEAEGEILDPETARTLEVGAKGQHLGGRLTWQASAFRMKFANLVVATQVDGRPALANAGHEKLEGYELEGAWHWADGLAVQAAYSYHDARFEDYVQDFDGVPTQLAGKRIEMSAHDLAAFGVSYRPAQGWTAQASLDYVGARFLDKRNTALAKAYTTFAAGLGYRFALWELRLDGENLTDERPPVAESELGDAQYYRLPARRLTATLALRF